MYISIYTETSHLGAYRADKLYIIGIGDKLLNTVKPIIMKP